MIVVGDPARSCRTGFDSCHALAAPSSVVSRMGRNRVADLKNKGFRDLAAEDAAAAGSRGACRDVIR
jgi:hypothetical protein